MDDFILAKGLCDKDKKVSSYFYEKYNEDIYGAVVSNLHTNHDMMIAGEEELFKINIFNKPHKITESRQEAYTWLLKKIQKISCSYKGKAPFMHYIRSIIYCKHTTRIDYIRKVKGSIQYLPKEIIEQGEIVSKVYRYMVQRKDRLYIQEVLKISDIEYLDASETVERFLTKKGKVDKILGPQKKQVFDFTEDSLDINIDGEFDQDNPNNEDKAQQLTEHSFELQEKLFTIHHIIDTHFTSAEKGIAIAYWSKQLSSKNIFEYLQQDGLSYLKNLNISKPEDIYAVISKMVAKFSKFFKKEVSGKTENENYDKKEVQLILENYFLYYFEKQKKLSTNYKG